MPSERAGWVKLWRNVLSNPVVTKDSEHLALWIHLLCSAAHEPTPALLGGQSITLQPGQLTTGRRQLVESTKIERSKVERILRTFQNAQLIEQRTTTKNRLITIVSWDETQRSEQRNEPQVSNERATSEQRVSTLEENNNTRNRERGLFDDAI